MLMRARCSRSQVEDLESDVEVIIVLKDFSDYWGGVQRTSHIVSELSLKYEISISPVRVGEVNCIQEDSPFCLFDFAVVGREPWNR